MNDDTNSPDSAPSEGPAGAEKGGAGTEHDNQQQKKFEVQSEDDGGAEPPTMEELEEAAEIDLDGALQRLEEAEGAVRKYKDDMLRVQAEMQNLRRRTEQDVEKAHKYGLEKFAAELLPVIDNLERALEAAGSSKDGEDDASTDDGRIKAIREGVELTLKSFQDCISKFSLEPVDPLGEPFDPQHHQAMATVDDDNVEPNTVTAVVQKGYLLHGRVIRPAMVMVSK